MNVIIDTGPIVAFLDKNEQHHSFVMHQMKSLEAPFYTCEAVLSEAFFLTGSKSIFQQKLSDLLASGKIECPFSYTQNASSVLNFLNKYADQPASLADACLVRIAEITPQSKVFTLDSDFTIYRTLKGKRIPLIFPEN